MPVADCAFYAFVAKRAFDWYLASGNKEDPQMQTGVVTLTIILMALYERLKEPRWAEEVRLLGLPWLSMYLPRHPEIVAKLKQAGCGGVAT
jgi:hypothetical protein